MVDDKYSIKKFKYNLTRNQVFRHENEGSLINNEKENN
ncbi:MAG: hypothetical protein A370_02512 [Clostridium sp. Maddingley MBC34-26]|nr:MAG: hypothetical protein A370_02512 [Clostridium sp. Maddingley MBC34-26]